MPALAYRAFAQCNRANPLQAKGHGIALCEGLATRRLSGVVVGVRGWTEGICCAVADKYGAGSEGF